MRLRFAAIAILAALAVALPGCLKGSGGIFGNADPPGPRDFVSSKDYTKWVIEVDTIEGMAPPTSAVNLLKARLESVVSKPDGIEIRSDDSALPARGGTWTLDDLQKYSSQHLDAKTEGKTAVIHLLFLDGRYENDALGVTISSYRGDTVVSSGPVAIFSAAIRGACDSLLDLCTDPTPIWGPVLVHEFGHAMGLVNVGAPMKVDHEDPDHRGHSSNQGSVMWWQVETNAITQLIPGGIPDDYDANDRADLCGIGGKC